MRTWWKSSTPSELLPAKQKASSVYWQAIPLKPGLYKIDIAIKDVNNPDHMGRWTRSINVPKFDDDTLGHSSLILADVMRRVPSKEIGGGSFVLGDTFVRPRVWVVPPGGRVPAPPMFSRAQTLNFWMQVYNLGIDDKSKQNDATVTYQIVDLTTQQAGAGYAGVDQEAESECGPVDAGEEPPAGQLPAGNVSVEHQGERCGIQAADGRVSEVYRQLIGMMEDRSKRGSRKGARLQELEGERAELAGWTITRIGLAIVDGWRGAS